MVGKVCRNCARIMATLSRRCLLGQAVHLTRDLGMLRIAAAIPPLRVADVDFNVGGIIGYIHKAREAGVQVLTFP